MSKKITKRGRYIMKVLMLNGSPRTKGNTFIALEEMKKGGGHNWWCVLYPNLCFTNATCAVVDEDGKKELKEALSAEEYEMVTATSEFKIKWFFFGKDHAKESD